MKLHNDLDKLEFIRDNLNTNRTNAYKTFIDEKYNWLDVKTTCFNENIKPSPFEQLYYYYQISYLQSEGENWNGEIDLIESKIQISISEFRHDAEDSYSIQWIQLNLEVALKTKDYKEYASFRRFYNICFNLREIEKEIRLIKSKLNPVQQNLNKFLVH
jgi:hypothetical protein